MATDLATLTEALDDPDIDISESLQQLAADARLAVLSYLGLSISIATADDTLVFTAMDDAADARKVQTSLAMALTSAPLLGRGSPAAVTLVLFAGTPGAFVDIAADVAWLAVAEGAVSLDQHLVVNLVEPRSPALQNLSTVNQAIGVLIGRGNTPEEADFEINLLAASAGFGRPEAAARIIATIDHPRLDPG